MYNDSLISVNVKLSLATDQKLSHTGLRPAAILIVNKLCYGCVGKNKKKLSLLELVSPLFIKE